MIFQLLLGLWWAWLLPKDGKRTGCAGVEHFLCCLRPLQHPVPDVFCKVPDSELKNKNPNQTLASNTEIKSLWLITADESLAVVKKSYLFAKHCFVWSLGVTKHFIIKLISRRHCKWRSTIALGSFVAWGYAGEILRRGWRVLAESLTAE